MLPLDDYIKNQLLEHLTKIEELLNADVMTIVGPIWPGLDVTVRDAIKGSKVIWTFSPHIYAAA